MKNQQTASRSSDYVKIPNFPGLYRNTRTQRYWAVKKVNGRRRERSLGTADRKIAERRLVEWVRDLATIDIETERTTLKQLCEKFLALNKGKSKSSQSIEAAILQSFTQWWPYGLGVKVRDIRPSQLEEWLVLHEGRLKNASYNRYAGVLKQLFEIAAKDRIVAQSPFKGVRTQWKKPQTPVRCVPTLDQFQAIVDTIRSQPLSRYAGRTADFIEFIGLAGLGQAEASSLKWGDIDWEQNRISVRRHKTDRRFHIPIYPHLRPFLERLMTEAGTAVTATTPVLKIKDGKKALTTACKVLGYHRFSQRNLRQCHIMRLWHSGVDRKLIAKWQGHQDGGQLILDTYTEVFGDDQVEYEQRQLSKLGPPGVAFAGQASPIMQTARSEKSPSTTSKPLSAVPKFESVENPFKPDDVVMTLIKGAKVKVSVRQVWNREVQVKTADGTLLWRTMYTVWFPGSKPISKSAEPNTVETTSPIPAVQVSRNGASHPKPEAGAKAIAPEQKTTPVKKRRARRRGKKSQDSSPPRCGMMATRPPFPGNGSSDGRRLKNDLQWKSPLSPQNISSQSEC